MEFTDEMLGRLAGNIADLRIKFAVVRACLIQLGMDEAELDKIINQSSGGPEFEQTRALVLKQLQGG